MAKLNERQLLVVTLIVPLLAVAGIGWLTWADYQKIYAAEISDERPENAEITDPALWGEHRKCQEIRKEMEGHRVEADLIPKREQDVIVYREIVQRDSQILPDKDLVTQFVTTIDEFSRQSGVAVTDVSDLNLVGTQGQAISRVPIRMALTGSFDQFLKFVNLFETMPRIVNTRAFALTAGRQLGNDDPEAPPVHTISLELDTYVYAAGAGIAKPVEIANYERRKDDPAIQKLVRQQKAAKVATYQLRPRINRRDPAADPRRAQTGPGAAGLTPEEFEELKATVDRHKQDVALLQEDMRLMQQYLQEKKYLQYVQIKAQVDEKIRTLQVSIKEADAKMVVPELREMWSEEVVVPFTTIAGDLSKDSGAQGPQVILKQHVAEFLEKQRTALEDRKYEEVVKIAKELELLLKSPNTKLADDADPFVAELRENARQAGVMLEFEALKLKVTGIIRMESQSIVICGGKHIREGDHADKGNRCKLVEIKDDALVFELDGCEIEYQLEKR